MTAVSLEGKTILVTGAAGFIGSNLAERLLGTIPAVQVIGLDNVNDYYDVHLKYARLSELEQYERFEFIKADLSDKKAIDALFSRYQPEIVVNLAAQAGVRYSITHPDAYIQSNLVGFSISLRHVVIILLSIWYMRRVRRFTVVIRKYHFHER